MLTLIFSIAIIGIICWLITLIPKPAVFNQIIIGVGIIFAILLVLQSVGHPIGPRINLW